MFVCVVCVRVLSVGVIRCVFVCVCGLACWRLFVCVFVCAPVRLCFD